MDLGALITEAREVLDELVSPPLIPLASLKRKGPTSQHYGGTQGASTSAARPKNVSKATGGGDGTQAGVAPKSLDKREPTVSKTFQRDKSAKNKGPIPKGAKRDREPTQALPKGKGEKPSCPGGQAPRMVFGKWRCSAPTSKGAQQAKSRIATKRKAKGQKKAAPKGALAKLVHKARKALVGLFK